MTVGLLSPDSNQIRKDYEEKIVSATTEQEHRDLWHKYMRDMKAANPSIVLYPDQWKAAFPDKYPEYRAPAGQNSGILRPATAADLVPVPSVPSAHPAPPSVTVPATLPTLPPYAPPAPTPMPPLNLAGAGPAYMQPYTGLHNEPYGQAPPAAPPVTVQATPPILNSVGKQAVPGQQPAPNGTPYPDIGSLIRALGLDQQQAQASTPPPRSADDEMPNRWRFPWQAP